MAPRAQQITPFAGFFAAAFVTVLVGAAIGAVLWRAETVGGLRAADAQAITFTVTQAFVSAALSVGLAIPLARALNRSRFPGRRLLITFLGAPFILPVIVAVMGLISLFGRNGWINSLFESVGLPAVTIYGIHGVILAHVFFNLPLATRIILHGWQRIPAEHFRLGAQLGLRRGASFRCLEWPMLRQNAPGAFALIFVICLTSFAVALTLGGGPRATTIELAIYQAFRFEFDLGRAALLSLVQIGIAGAAAFLAFWILPPLTVLRGTDETPKRWSHPSALVRAQDTIWITVSAIFLLLPIVSVAATGVWGLLSLPMAIWQSALVSLGVSAASTALLLLLALPLAAWFAGHGKGGLEGLSLLGLVASPLMIGTGWFILINPIANPQNYALIVTALVNALMALPFAIRFLISPMRQIIANYGRLSLALGLDGWQLWRIVLLPRLRPAIGYSAALGSALSIGDLGVVALFASREITTLPMQMYRLMGQYQNDLAASAALVLMSLAFIVFWLCDRWGQYDLR